MPSDSEATGGGTRGGHRGSRSESPYLCRMYTLGKPPSVLLLGHALYFAPQGLPGLESELSLETERELRSNCRSRSSRGATEKDRQCLARWFQILQEKHG